MCRFPGAWKGRLSLRSLKKHIKPAYRIDDIWYQHHQDRQERDLGAEGSAVVDRRAVRSPGRHGAVTRLLE